MTCPPLLSLGLASPDSVTVISLVIQAGFPHSFASPISGSSLGPSVSLHLQAGVLQAPRWEPPAGASSLPEKRACNELAECISQFPHKTQDS